MFPWLVFAILCIQLAKEFGMPPVVGQAMQGALLLILLFVLVGVV
jgi:hypothetical protein